MTGQIEYPGEKITWIVIVNGRFEINSGRWHDVYQNGKIIELKETKIMISKQITDTVNSDRQPLVF